MIIRNIIKKNRYYDSVTLMVISSKVSELEGIHNAAVMMGTEHNRSLMINSGLLLEENKDITPNDVVIGINGIDEQSIDYAVREIELLLENRNKSSVDGDVRTKTLEAALNRIDGANFAIISVPGKYAKNEAIKALKKGLHVLLFSDNVTLEEEIELKDIAEKQGLFMMGPDCGTAIINGISLGFANVIRRGNIGMVAASGTGLQEIACIIHNMGSGVSQALGTGGRDLKDEVDGKMMLMGLEALAEDIDTEIIVLVSKPGSDKVTKKVLSAIDKINKPVVICFLGGDTSVALNSKAIFAQTLEEAAITAVNISNGKDIKNISYSMPESESKQMIERETAKLKAEQKYVRALYSGGTLCYEGMLVMSQYIGNIYSNVPLKNGIVLENVEQSNQHTFLDMGDDYFTDGRPHPMIDSRLRMERIKREGADPQCCVILLDVVLGYGAHNDPAGIMVNTITEVKKKAEDEGRYLSLVASVCGTDLDPQVRKEQENKLKECGVVVMPSNAQAARLAAFIVTRRTFIGK